MLGIHLFTCIIRFNQHTYWKWWHWSNQFQNKRRLYSTFRSKMTTPNAAASVTTDGPLPSTRRDHLLSIEQKIQAKWDKARVFEVDSIPGPRDPQSKYLATFPYPYMNGALHLGHAFTLVKVDYQCHYQRLKGKNALYPFGFHCTGMPIAACADRLKREIELFGNPPVFPEDLPQPAETEDVQMEEKDEPQAPPPAEAEASASTAAVPAPKKRVSTQYNSICSVAVT